MTMDSKGNSNKQKGNKKMREKKEMTTMRATRIRMRKEMLFLL